MGMLDRSIVAHGLGRRAADVVDAVTRAAGIYGAAPTCHGAFAARVPDYVPAMLETAVESRALVRVAAMRASIYLVPRALLPHALTLAHPHGSTLRRRMKLDHGDYTRMTEEVRKILSNHPRGAMTAAEIKKGLAAAGHAEMEHLLGVMSRDNSLVRTRIRGGVRSQIFEYAWLDDWIEAAERPSLHDALLAWARLWLEANGPATIEDFAWWAAIKPKEARPIFDALGTVRRDGLEATEAQWDAVAAAPLDDSLQLLPMWDSWLMAHKDRSRYLDPAHAPRVIDKSGNVTNVILQRGRVVGLWDIDGTTLLYAPFGKLTKSAMLVAAQTLVNLWPIDDARAVTEPRPLRESPVNRFLAPLVARPG